MKPRIETKYIDSIKVLTERVEMLKREGEQATPYATSQTSHSFTTSWKETEGLPIDLRRAKAFAKVLADNPVVIRDGELIVGSTTKYVRGSTPMTSIDPASTIKKLEARSMKRLRSARLPIQIEEEDEKQFREDAQFWDNYLPKNDYLKEELRRELGDEYFDMLADNARVLDYFPPVRELRLNNLSGPILNLRIMRDGLNSVIARAKAELEKANGPTDRVLYLPSHGYHKRILLTSMIIACKAIIDFAKRHAEFARNKAGKESDPVRKMELEQIAERCEWVPANSPRSFAEALQSIQFILLGLRREPYGDLANLALGRLDQYLYPYYEKDLKEGRITRQDAAELLGCLFVKANEAEALLQGAKITEVAAGAAFLSHITIGGKTKDGKDATNELSYLILETASQLKYPEPAIYIRYHDGMKKEFLIKALEVNRDLGGGNPAFLNDEIGTQRFLSRGCDIDDAVDWDVIGCLEAHLPHVYIGGGLIGLMNLPKIFELALNNGFDSRTGKQLGLKTGDVTKFTRIEQFYEAFEKQVNRFVDISLKAYFITQSITSMEQGNAPFTSVMFEDCITSGLGPQEGGCARYPELINCLVAERGCNDVADSLTAIKKLVFDEKKLTIAKLMEALKANWEGYEDVYQASLKAPKYGNDDNYADEMFNYISLKVQEIILSKRDPFTGRKLRLIRPAGPGHVPAGEVVGALPNGRKAWSPEYDTALSPMPGGDVNGPTAVINSATKANHAKEEYGITLNMKFSRPLLASQEKLENMLSLLKTFMDRDGWHIQFNILNADELIDAKKHPEKWKNLVVRVAGYSAYFVELAPPLQDEIIARTMHGS